MQQTTIDAVKAILATDQSIDADERKNMVLMLKMGAGNGPSKAVKDRIVSRKEFATRVGVTTRTIDNWRVKGYITPVIIPGKNRAVGYRERDVDGLIEGAPF